MCQNNPEYETGAKEVSWETAEEYPEVTGLGDGHNPGPDQPK
jgi:hypothetical protein